MTVKNFSINGWEHFELEEQIASSNLDQLLKLFKQKNDEYSQECVVMLHMDRETEEGARQYEKCTFLFEEKLKISLSIANEMTGLR